MKRMWRLPLMLCGLGVAVLFLSAAQADALVATPPAVQLVVKGVGLAILGIAAEFLRRLYTRVMAALDMLPNIASALWGTPSPEGKRTGGLVSDVHEIKQALEEMREA
jgi:hypothetical protein